MYKIQIFYDEASKEIAIQTAAHRLGVPPPAIEEIWHDRQFFVKKWLGIPIEVIQVVEVNSEEMDEESPQYYQTRSVSEEVFDGEELWFPLGWDASLIAAIKISNIFTLSNSGELLDVYFYC